MTNREKLNSMTDEEFAEWLCGQIFDSYQDDDPINVVRYHMVRNFLKSEYNPDGLLDKDKF